MTLNGRYAVCCRKHESFGAHHKNLNEGKPILSAAKMLASDSSFWRYTICANIRGGSLNIKRQWGCWERIFSAFLLVIFSDTLQMRPALLYGDMHCVVGFLVIPSAWPCMALTIYFALNSVFAPVWLSETVRLRRIIAWKLMKIDTYRRRCKSSEGTTFWHYKVCADIRSVSLERRR